MPGVPVVAHVLPVTIIVGLLVDGLSVWLNLGIERAVGLCALSLWSLGLRFERVVLGSGARKNISNLLTGVSCFRSCEPIERRVGSSGSSRSILILVLPS